MKARVKKLEHTIYNKVKQPNILFRIIKDKDSYRIPSELITLIGNNPEDYPKEGENRVVNSSSNLIGNILNIEAGGGVGLIMRKIISNGDPKD